MRGTRWWNAAEFFLISVETCLRIQGGNQLVHFLVIINASKETRRVRFLDHPTCCATRLLLGSWTIVVHPKRAKRWWIVAFRLHIGTRCSMHMTREGRP